MITLIYKYFAILVSILGLLLLVGCKTELDSQEAPLETSEEPFILFCPDELCEEKLVDLVKYAQKSVHCAIYDLSLEGLKSIFQDKSDDIEVKLVLEEDNYKERISGPEIKLDKNRNYMHNKFCIIDGVILWTGSMNPTYKGAYENNNNILIFSSKYITENYEDEFLEMWNGEYASGNHVRYPEIMFNSMEIENYFCPEDNCADNVIEEINEAKESIYFMTFSFTDEEIADAILFKDVEIKGIFEALQAGSEYSQYQRMKDFGIDVIKDKNKAAMHHKVFIIDNSTVITGSYNPTFAGNNRNDENIIIIHDKGIALKYVDEFEKVWNLE